MEESSSLGPSFEVPSGASLTTMLAAVTCIALGAGALLVLWRWLKDRPGTPRWVMVCGGAPAVAMVGLGTYLLVSERTHGSLPYGSVPYANYEVNAGGMEPLELTVLATIVLAVMLVGVTKPRLLVLLLALCLVAVLMLALLPSFAYRGPDLFGDPSQLRPAAGYTEEVNALRGLGPAAVPSIQEPNTGAVERRAGDSGIGDSRTGEAVGTGELLSETPGGASADGPSAAVNPGRSGNHHRGIGAGLHGSQRGKNHPGGSALPFDRHPNRSRWSASTLHAGNHRCRRTA